MKLQQIKIFLGQTADCKTLFTCNKTAAVWSNISWRNTQENKH